MSTHGPLLKYATPMSQPVWLGVGIEDPSGVVETKVHSWGTLEEILTYIFSHKHMHVHTRLFFILFVPFSLQAETSPMTFTKNMINIRSQHVASCNGNEGHSLPTRARIATGKKYPGGGDGKIRNAIAFEDPTNSRSDGAKAHITFDFTGHKVAKTRILSKWLTKLTHLCCVLSFF